ncbi:MAG TPA: hypothetical protein VNV16_11830 [Methylibium sp.]|nr:hypothetical protein [Methylibium sp.]
MNKTELLALAECLFDQDEGIPADEPTPSRDAAAILRKLAALEPVAWTSQSWLDSPGTSPKILAPIRRDGFDIPVYNLTGIIDHE